MNKFTKILNEMAVSTSSYNKIKPTDRIIISNDSMINPRNVKQDQGADRKPNGLWYALGTAWVDWIRREGNPSWEKDNVFKIEIDDRKILKMYEDISMSDFEDDPWGDDPDWISDSNDEIENGTGQSESKINVSTGKAIKRQEINGPTIWILLL